VVSKEFSTEYKNYFKNNYLNLPHVIDRVYLKTIAYLYGLNTKEQKSFFYLHEIPCIFFPFTTFSIE